MSETVLPPETVGPGAAIDDAAPPAAIPAKPTLPIWPLTLSFGLMPVWWVLGIWYFTWPFFGVVLFVLMTARGRIRVPAGTPLWLVFLGLVLASATRLDRLDSLLTFTLRFGLLATAFLVGVYVYNLVRDGVPWSRIANPLAVFWLGLVVLGWLSVLAPTLSLPSPFLGTLPDAIAHTRYLQAIAQLHATEFNPLSANPIYRPAAPFPYTNNWGTAYAFLVPFVLAYLTSVRRGRMWTTLLISVPLSIVPAFLTLNRGMFVGLGGGLLFLLARELVRGRLRLLIPVAALALIGAVVALFIPVGDMIAHRTSTTDTNLDRFDLYLHTWDAVTRSPLLGFGQPASVDTTHAAEPLGTQGMLWQVLYSHGIPAVLCLYLLLAVVARRLSAAVSTAGSWLSMPPIVAIVVTPFYAYIDPNMSVLFYVVGLGLAAVDGPVNRSRDTA